jgi:hypothetical protein
MAKTFKTAAAFRMSLETRLKDIADARGIPLDTMRLKVVIARLLARVFHAPDPPWLLKGGFGLEIRYHPRARATKDIDLMVGRMAVPEDRESFAAELLERLREAAEQDLGDFLQYRIAETGQELERAPLGGARYSCEVRLSGKVYARFHLDLGLGDAVTDEPEWLEGENLLEFAGLDPVRVRVISRAQQFAE